MIADVAVGETRKKGMGVFALRDFRKGEFIFKNSKGRMVEEKNLSKLSKMDIMHIDELGEGKYEVMRSPGCYVNHSCDPNAVCKGRSYYALKKIPKGGEICVDYRVDGLFNNEWRCHCGSDNCTGHVVSNFFTLPEEMQRKYLPYTLREIRKEYENRRKESIPKAIIFDMDGTIVPLQLVVRSFEETCKHFGIRFVNTNKMMGTVLTSRKILDNAIGYKLTEILQDLIPEAMSFEKDFINYYEKIQIKNFKKYASLLPHVREAFQEVRKRKIKIAIVTTKSRNQTMAIVRGYRLPFDAVVGGDDVRKRKPCPDPILKACKILDLKPSQCVMVGDHPFDMMASKRAGCSSIGVLTGWGDRKDLENAGATYVIKNLGFLIKLLERW
jgi:HAD superfamily hydrolase (TIGR01662 family)